MNQENNSSEHADARSSTPDNSVLKNASRFEKYAATQAAGDGVQGDVKKKNKTEAEKLGAQMADMK